MNAQEKWKALYFDYKLAKKFSTGATDDWRMDMWLCRREAALERKLEAAQRTIAAQEQQLEALGKAYDAMRDTVMDLTL